MIKKTSKRREVKASNTKLVRRASRIVADDEIVEEPVEEPVVEDELAAVEVDPEATELVFEAEDVAELVAEVTGQEVSVTVDTDQVVFTVGEDEYTVTPEGDEEILEASSKILRGKKNVNASRRLARRRK